MKLFWLISWPICIPKENTKHHHCHEQAPFRKNVQNAENTRVPVSLAAARSERKMIFEGFPASEPAKDRIMTLTNGYCV